jgi:hypothetical protein
LYGPAFGDSDDEDMSREGAPDRDMDNISDSGENMDDIDN